MPHTVYVEDGAYAKVHKLCAHVVPLPWKNNNWDLTVLVNPNSQHTWIIQLYLPSFPICYWACHCEHNINLTRKVWHMPVYAETCTIHNMTSCVPWPLLIHNHPQVYTWYNATSYYSMNGDGSLFNLIKVQTGLTNDNSSNGKCSKDQCTQETGSCSSGMWLSWVATCLFGTKSIRVFNMCRRCENTKRPSDITLTAVIVKLSTHCNCVNGLISQLCIYSSKVHW